MDLSTVKRKLEANSYSTFSAFCADVDLIWNNAAEYNGPTSHIASLGFQLRTWFKKMTMFMSDDETQDWLGKLGELVTRHNELSMKFTADTDTNPTSKSYAPSTDSESDTATIAPPPEALKVPKHARQKTTSEPAQKSHRPRPPKPAAERPPKPPKVPLEGNLKLPKRIAAARLSVTDTADLVDRVNGMDDLDQIQKVVSIIKKYQPDWDWEAGEDIDFLALPMHVRALIREFLSSLDD
jgi:hypothetical protein